MQGNKMRILMLGDAIGQAGRALFAKYARELKERESLDAIIVNGENSGDQGRGITPKIADFFVEHGADCITTGNHIWFKREIYAYLDEHTHVLRPANYPAGAPGTGVHVFTLNGHKVAVVNLQGRIFMKEQVDDPFRALDSILAFLKDKTNIILVDFHAEATSEKQAIGYYADGRVSAVVGTHTHVQTADERILPNQTAYITDLGMSGSLNSMIGMQKEPILKNFLTQMPVRFVPAQDPPFVLAGVIIEIDTTTGKAKTIDRVRIIDDTLKVA